LFFFFSSRRRHTRSKRDWSSDVCSSDLEGILSYPNGEALLEEALKLGADVVGAIPHFEFTREYGVESLKIAFDLAEKYDTLIDVHCDEIDDEQSRFVEVVANVALKRGLGEKTTASHTTSMS